LKVVAEFPQYKPAVVVRALALPASPTKAAGPQTNKPSGEGRGELRVFYVEPQKCQAETSPATPDSAARQRDLRLTVAAFRCPASTGAKTLQVAGPQQFTIFLDNKHRILQYHYRNL
jgi:hypothetical protein